MYLSCYFFKKLLNPTLVTCFNRIGHLYKRYMSTVTHHLSRAEGGGEQKNKDPRVGERTTVHPHHPHRNEDATF